MGDISALLANAADTKADFDLGKINRSYWEGKDQFAKNDLRDAFKGGVPTNPDGSIDYGAIQRTLYQKGAIGEANSLMGAGVREGELRLMNGQPPQMAQARPDMLPPSANRGATVADGPPRNQQGGETEGGPQGAPQDAQPTVMKIVAQHVPNDQLQAASDSVARMLGVSPTAPLNVNDPQVRNVLVPAIAQIKRMGLGQVPGDNPSQPVKVAPAPQDDYELKKWTFLAASQDKQIAAAAKARLEALQKDRELTQDQKNAAATGQSVKDYQNRADENTTQRDILTKWTLPRIAESQTKATSAVEDIDAIHRSRGELDQTGGVFSGKWADMRLQAAKIGNLLGMNDADKITSTEAYSAAIGKRVAAMVKAFGSGTAISDGDRRFAEKMAGGNIELNETSMRRILDIGEKADRAIIDRHNTFAGRAIKSNEGLKEAAGTLTVDQPGQYQKAAQPPRKAVSPASGTAQASPMISSKADYDKLPSGAQFTGPDGKPWQKP